MTLSEAIEFFLKTNDTILSVATQQTYRHTLQAFVAWMNERRAGDVDITAVSREDIRAYIDYMSRRKRQGPGRKYPSIVEGESAKARRRKKQLSMFTVHQHIRNIKRLFNFLQQEGLILPAGNPVTGISNVKIPKMAMQSISVESLTRMIQEASQPAELVRFDARDAAIAALMGAPGQDRADLAIGSGELARLKMGDVAGDVLHLVARPFGHSPVDVPFIVHMTTGQGEALRRWLAMRPQTSGDHAFVTFDGRGEHGTGGPMRVKAIYAAFRKYTDMTPEERETRARVIAHETKYAARRLALLLFFLDTGARLGGICGLTRDRLDLDNGRALVVEKGENVRTVFFSDQTATAVRAWLQLRDDDNPSVFAIKPFRARQMLDSLAETAGVDGIHNPHAFRHTFAKMAILKGADLSMVQRFLGHSSVKVTSDFYSHWNVAELARVHQKVSPVALLLSDEEE